MHKYNLKGELVEPWEDGLWSVTTILDIRRNHGLEAWRRRVGDEEADRRSAESAQRGSDVHTLIEVLGLGDVYSFYSGDVFIDHAVNAFFRWKRQVKAEILGQEIFLINPREQYAGTADLVCKIDGVVWIVDLKTSSHLHPEYGLQLAAYRKAFYYLHHFEPWTAVLQLGTNTARGWRWQQYTEPLKPFLAHKIVFDWQLKHEPILKPRATELWHSGM